MATATKSKTLNSARLQTADVQYQEPKRLSKFALWRRENPMGILEYVDWRSANR